MLNTKLDSAYLLCLKQFNSAIQAIMQIQYILITQMA